VDDAGVGAPAADELLGVVAEGGDVGRDVLHDPLVAGLPAERHQRAGDEQVAFVLQDFLARRRPAISVLRLCSRSASEHDHGVEGLGELTHEVDALDCSRHGRSRFWLAR